MSSLTIVIPVFNQFEWTETCLTALKEETKDYEVILVDNGSTDETKSLGEEFGMRIIRNNENLGFPRAVNQALKKIDSGLICLLNNDVIVTPGWSERLKEVLNDGFSIVGPMTNYCSGGQKVKIANYNDKAELKINSLEWSKECGKKITEVNWVIGFCMMFDKGLVDEIGLFDESFDICCGEEVDLCLRARSKGHKVAIVRDVYVHHEGSVTFEAMEVDYQSLCRQNEDHLRNRWGIYSEQQRVTPVVQLKSEALVSDQKGQVKLNLGCGFSKIEGYINIDNRSEVEPDLVCDLSEGLPYGDNSVDEIRAYDFLEHIRPGEPVVKIVEEIYRVLKSDGKFEHYTPSTDSRAAWQDPFHLSYWNLNSWLYFMHDEYRDLYGIKAKFRGDNVNVTDNITRDIVHVHGILYAVKKEEIAK
jgi:glycosyltransferase involved in cell wall biosynthesis